MKSFEEKTIRSKNIYEGKIIDVRVDDVRLPDGKKGKRELVHHPGAVAILAITNEGKIVLVKQYRKALEKAIVELPAGQLEKNEKPIDTAIRELEEETNYTTKKESLKLIDSFYTSPGFADEIIYLYETDEIYLLEHFVEGDSDEFIEKLEVTLEEAIELIRKKIIHDAKTIYAIRYLQWKVKGE